MKIKYTVQL